MRDKFATMSGSADLNKVNIRPGVSILSVLRHLNYRPWFAIAEFVDNAIQSSLDHAQELRRVHGGAFHLVVNIELDPTDGGRIRIADNAAGIAKSEFARAFRPAEIPPDQSGLCEFGMGMKSAACWFAPEWTVRTAALEEGVERTVHFDITKIVRDDVEELDIQSASASADAHFTEVVLRNPYKVPQGRTVGKMKDHLASIYRIFIRHGLIDLRFDGDGLSWAEPKVLLAPYYRTPAAQPQEWRKELDFDLGLGVRARGFAAIRETASTSSAGFALFRRNRLIQGSGDEGYRPEYVFGKPNSYRYQRLFGELHLDGFEVSHTKDGFKWDEQEDTFLELLKEELDSEPLPLLEQAEEHRVRVLRRDLEHGAQEATERTAEAIRREVPPILEQQLGQEPDAKALPEALPAAPSASTREIDVELQGQQWRIRLELSTDPAVGDWLMVSNKIDRLPGRGIEPGRRQICVRLALAHPFMERFGGADREQIEPLLRVAAAMGLAEITAREGGLRQAGTIRRNVNELLRTALCRP